MFCWPTSGVMPTWGGNDALDLVVMDQLGNAEELLTLGAHSAAHIIGDESQVLGAQLHQLLQ